MNVYLLVTAVGAVGAVLLPCGYIYIASSVQKNYPKLTNKRICLLIAHPDDEAMFFAPTVLALTRPETGNHVKILCLSSGNADGLGETRKKELVKSAMSLGLRDEDDIFVLDDPNDFPDSMTTTWETDKISNLLCSAFAPFMGRQRADPSAPITASIDVLITFDAHGVSSHPNHISLFHGARAFIAQLMQGKSQHKSPVALYSLHSVGLGRKYTSVMDAVMTLALGSKAAEASHPESLVFMNALTGAGGLQTAWKAMTEAHKSQMVWFRYLWLGFSRYMLVNDLYLEKVSVEN
ncbi:N-acetylglucosaminyl phosphatidylinositol deacetylase [Stachybotrys elegans]|uniref:N-acetylglucosaminylphosphatidylinositol deacetylase n=1 Tax=Stachybotrys elegans TaxID=80388 RepID=A0A8K0SKG0_9HYPO|nr:N-acetylglucosaminyl phosphatidylinositol deacetylase [Stachybotrys elegans]